MNRTSRGKSIALLAALVGIISLSATVTHAGFQWVPPTGQPSAAGNEGAVPPGEPVPTADVEQVILPLPGEEQIPAEPQLNPGDAAANTAPPAQTLQLPPGYRAEPLPPPQNQNVLKVKTVTPQAAQQPPAQPAAPAPAAISPPPAPPPGAPVPLQREAQPYSPPPAPPSYAMPSPPPSPPAPVVTQTKVIMPEDAPQTAVDSTPNSERLVINPYPESGGQVPSPQPMAQPAPEPLPAPSNMAVVEGFGSDMPLAMALQQIIPPGYAYAFEQSVNPGQFVSWDGGKPWDQIISEMLEPLNLEAVIEDKVVHVQPEGLQRQSAATPEQAVPLRRANINDPGEQSQASVMVETLPGIETAAGEPENIIAAPPAAAPAPQLPLPPQTGEQEISGQQAVEQPQAAGPWEAKAGESLKDILTRWSEKAGVEMIWMAAYDYKIKQDISLENNFADAVQTIVSTGIDAEAGPEIEITQNAAAPNLVIRDKRA